MLVPKKYIMSLYVHSLFNLTKLNEDVVDESHKDYNVNGGVNFPLAVASRVCHNN